MLVIKLNFLRKLFGKKEKEEEVQNEPEKITLGLEEIQDWMKSESNDAFSDMKPYITQKYKEIKSHLDSLEKDKKELESVEIKNQGIPRAVQSNKENFVKNLNIILDKISIPYDTDPSTAHRFYTEAMSTLNTCVENSIKSQHYIKPIFPEIFKNLSNDLSEINTSLSDLEDKINNIKDRLNIYENLPEKIDEVNQIKKQIEDKKSNIQELEKKYESSKSHLSDAQTRLETLKASENYQKAEGLENEIQKLRDEKSNIDSELKDLFAPLSKAISRMEKQDKSDRHTLSPEFREVIEKINNNEVHLLDKDKLASFLNDMKNRVEDGSLGLKQRKGNNIIEQVNHLLESDEFSNLVEKRLSYTSRIEELEVELDRLTVYKEKANLEKQISDNKNTMDTVQSEIDSERKHLDELNQKKDQLLEELQSDLKYVFNKQIEIKH